MLGLRLDGRVAVRVRADDRAADRRRVLPVRVSQSELARRHVTIVEHQRDGVDFGDVEPAAGANEVGDDPRPVPDVRQPTQHAARGVDEVERAFEDVRQVIQVRPHEPRLRVADLVGNRAGEVDGDLAEVGPGHPRTQPGEGQGVHAEMALEMQDLEALDRPDLLELELLEPDAASLEGGQVIELRGLVDPGPLVPEGVVVPKRRFPLGHGRLTAPRRRSRPGRDRQDGRTQRSRRRASGSTASPRAAGRRRPPRAGRSSERRSGSRRRRRPGRSR